MIRHYLLYRKCQYLKYCRRVGWSEERCDIGTRRSPRTNIAKIAHFYPLFSYTHKIIFSQAAIAPALIPWASYLFYV